MTEAVLRARRAFPVGLYLEFSRVTFLKMSAYKKTNLIGVYLRTFMDGTHTHVKIKRGWRSLQHITKLTWRKI